MNKISVVGDSSIDHFLMLDGQDAGLRINSKNHKQELCFKYSEKTSIDEQQDSFGGSALNVAVALSHLNCEASLSTIIGADYEGKEIMNFLSSKSVITDNVEVGGKTNQSFIIVYSQDRTILSHHEKRNYSHLKISDSDILYFASAGQGSDSLIEKVKSSVNKGTKLVFNPGSFEISSFGYFKPLLSQTTILIINREEAKQLLPGTHEVVAQLEKILDFGTTVAVITDGANGAYFGTNEGHFHMFAFPASVKDPTGAGDAFASALVAGLAKGKSLEEAAKWGMINASYVVETLGANSALCSMSQINKELQSNKVLKFSRI